MNELDTCVRRAECCAIEIGEKVAVSKSRQLFESWCCVGVVCCEWSPPTGKTDGLLVWETRRKNIGGLGRHRDWVSDDFWKLVAFCCAKWSAEIEPSLTLLPLDSLISSWNTSSPAAKWTINVSQHSNYYSRYIWLYTWRCWKQKGVRKISPT